MEKRISDRNILKCILQQEDVMLWTLEVWLRTGFNGGFLQNLCNLRRVCDLRPNEQWDKCFDSCLTEGCW